MEIFCFAAIFLTIFDASSPGSCFPPGADLEARLVGLDVFRFFCAMVSLQVTRCVERRQGRYRGIRSIMCSLVLVAMNTAR